MNWQLNEFSISTDKHLLNLEYIHDYLSNQSYWAGGIPLEVVKNSIDGSLCFGIYEGEKQIGFARVITDMATFGWLADVFVDEAYRGRGLSKWLVEVILSHPGLAGLRRMMLGTLDAHSLYAKYGFTPLTSPERFMQIHWPDVYKKAQS